MYIYDLIFNFLNTHIFNPNVENNILNNIVFNIGGVDISMTNWINHTITIIVLVLILIMIIRLIVWIFSLFANMLGGR